MTEEVTILMLDFGGHVYAHHLGLVEDFDDAVFERLLFDYMNNECGMLPYDGGRINLRACARVWYETHEVH
jgi:hypothetical protein